MDRQNTYVLVLDRYGNEVISSEISLVETLRPDDYVTYDVKNRTGDYITVENIRVNGSCIHSEGRFWFRDGKALIMIEECRRQYKSDGLEKCGLWPALFALNELGNQLIH